MDFGVWVQNPNPPNMAQAGQTQTDQGQHQPPPPTPPNGGGSNSGDGTLFSHQVEHPGVVCDACNLGIFGFRYKCLKCVDYDLCATCERRGLHAGHCMMRIPFPEMAAEAIKRHIGTTVGPDVNFPFGQYEHDREQHRHPHPCGGRGGHEGRPDHCRGRGHNRRRHSHSSPESSDETKQPPAWCPYQVGRKEWKKWAKTMKKTAGAHKRSAEAFMKSAGGGSTENAGERQASYQAGTVPAAGPIPTPVNLTAAANQIQEFLNAFGLPIDVVELYQEWGGGRATSAPQPTTNANTNVQQESSAGNETPMTTNQPELPGTSSTQEDITDQFQDLNIRGEAPLNLSRDGSEASTGDDLILLASGTTSVRTPEGEGDSEWTLVDDNESAPRTNAVPNAVAPSLAGSAEGVSDGYPSVPEEFRETKVFRQIPIVQETSPAPPAASAPPTTQAVPIYPQLGPLMAPLVTGLTNAVGNVTRNIPPMPWGPPQQQQQAPIQPPSSPGMNEQMTYTLNQLLSMGFSNHNGDLARLVHSKNGHLENVLNSLFPPASN